jgi:NADH:ubiquinone oxidoreductase subunit 2 (subunit N)
MIPPLVGFFAKQQVLLSSMQAGFYLGPFVAVFTSVIGAAYYLRIIKFLYFCDGFMVPPHKNNEGNEKLIVNLRNVFPVEENDPNFNIPLLPSNHLSLVIAILTCITLFFIVKPFLLLNVINMITLSLSWNISG